MAYPLIILGAGASNDFLDRNHFPDFEPDLDTWKPPTTVNLLNGAYFYSLISKFPEMDEIVSYIRGKMTDKNKTFESILTTLYHQHVKQNPQLYKSFMGLLFYLSELFRNVSNKYYRPTNNYKTLKHILAQAGNRAIFVNFNYDLLLESTFINEKYTEVNQYLNENFPIIKIHGACNWFWVRHINYFADFDESKSNYEIALNIAESLFKPSNGKENWKLVIKDNPPHSPQGANGISAFSYHPALALPIIEKNDFVCPLEHIDFLKNELNSIDRVIIIGWRMTDPLLMDLLNNELKKREIPIAYVGKRHADNYIESQGDHIKKNLRIIEREGFTHFINSDDGEKFITS